MFLHLEAITQQSHLLTNRKDKTLEKLSHQGQTAQGDDAQGYEAPALLHTQRDTGQPERLSSRGTTDGITQGTLYRPT